MDLENATEQELWTASAHEEGLSRARVLQQLGLRLYKRGAYDEAAATNETAADLFREAGEPQEEAWCRYGVAYSFKELKRWPDARDAFTAAAELFRVAGNEDEVASAVQLRGQCCSEIGEHEEALAHWDTAANLYLAADDPEGAARARYLRGELLGYLGRQSLALEEFRRVRDLYRGRGDAAAVARTDDRIAAALIDLGNVAEAIEVLRAALHVTETFDDVDRLAYATWRLGATLVMDERADEGLAVLDRARDLYGQQQNTVGIAQCDLQAANAMSQLGRIGDAVELYEKVVHLFDAVGRDSDVLIAEANLANAYARSGDEEGAADVNRRTIERARQIGDSQVQARVATRLARNLIELDRPGEALEVLAANPFDPDSDEVIEQARRQAASCTALMNAGRVTEAAAEASALIERLRGTALQAELAEAYAVLSDAALMEGDQVTGERHRAQAISLFLAAGDHRRARRLAQAFLTSSASDAVPA